MFNVILVCDKCLREIKIPNHEFNPYWSDTMMETTGWKMPKKFIKFVSEAYGDREIPASSVVCLCPKCKD